MRYWDKGEEPYETRDIPNNRISCLGILVIVILVIGISFVMGLG